MKKYDYIFFDLDGTLSDSAPGIVNSVTYALNRMGIDVADKEPLKKFVGPPLVESFSMYYNFTPDQIERAVMLFREYFEAQGISENCMYAGADILLEKLKYVGKIPVIATSKPEPFAKIILSRYGIDHYFHYIAGSTTDETRTKKDEVIAYALEACKILQQEGINVRVINMHTIKPLDEDAVINAAYQTGRIITAEEHSVIGGLGEAVAGVTARNCPVPISMVGVKDVFGRSGKPAELLKYYGLTSTDIVTAVKSLM